MLAPEVLTAVLLMDSRYLTNSQWRSVLQFIPVAQAMMPRTPPASTASGAGTLRKSTHAKPMMPAHATRRHGDGVIRPEQLVNVDQARPSASNDEELPRGTVGLLCGGTAGSMITCGVARMQHSPMHKVALGKGL